MSLVSTAIVPIVLLLALGALMRHRYVPDPGFWRGLEWSNYHVFTPALFVGSISAADLGDTSVKSLLLGVTVPITGAALLVVASSRWCGVEGARVTSLVQGSVRINTYIGLIFATALHGRTGTATFAIACAVVVPLVNVICVSTLSVYGNSGRTSAFHLLREFGTNPLILACGLGVALNALSLRPTGAVAATVNLLAAPALVSGTLAVGAATVLRVQGRDVVDIILTSSIKLVALPVAAAAIARLSGASDVLLTCVVLICAVPTAPSAYILAMRLGGDARLMAAITSTQTVVAIATMPLVLTLAT